jgi:hypothetical protein
VVNKASASAVKAVEEMEDPKAAAKQLSEEKQALEKESSEGDDEKEDKEE